MSNALHGLAARLDLASSRVTAEGLRPLLSSLGKAAESDFAEAGRAAAGADGRLSNWYGGKGSDPLTAQASVIGSKVTIRAVPGGPWRVMQSGAKAHWVQPKGNRTGRNGRPAAVSTPLGPRSQAHIPHTRGKQAWSKGKRAVQTRSPDRIADFVDAQMRSALRG